MPGRFILNLPIPASEADVDRWRAIVDAHREPVLVAAMKSQLAALDAIVGTALGLTPEDIEEIQRDLEADPFLKGIRPRYPGTVTRKQGFRTGLDSAERYD